MQFMDTPHEMTQKEFAALGGKSRAKRLTKEQRSEIARMGGNANLKKYGREFFSKIRFGQKVKKVLDN